MSGTNGELTHPLPGLLVRTARIGLRMLADPAAGADRIAERLAATVERLRRKGDSPAYPLQADWEVSLHRMIGAPWPCPLALRFKDEVWDPVVRDLARRGLRVGRGSYAGFDDADPGLARSLWCLVHHLCPRVVVETGVARGLTSRVLLEALERRGAGRLWSIDLPPLSISRDMKIREVAAAVPAGQRSRWRYLEGSSRRRLAPLLRQLGTVDLFVHDSLHSTRNVLFELAQAWPAISPGGVALCDDIDLSFGFKLFAESVNHHDVLYCTGDDGKRMFGLMRRLPAP